MAAAGQLWATLDDLARFGAFLLGDTGDVLDPTTLEEMAVPAGVDDSASGWSAYGLGLQVMRVDGQTLVGHGGSMPGFLAGVFVDREEQTGAVSLALVTRKPLLAVNLGGLSLGELAISLLNTSEGLVKLELLEDTAGKEQTGSVCGGPVGKTVGDAVSLQLVGAVIC